MNKPHKTRLALIAIAAVAMLAPAAASADVVVPDDQIVQGSQCIGFDCVNNEIFGFASLLAKENNTRILFNDTSNAASNPSNNWGLIANYNNNSTATANYFGLMDLGDDGTDVTGPGVYPFKVAAGAGNNAFFVGSGGNVGLGTADPGKALQITRDDSPTVRLEQTNGGGFTAQTWDVAGNEANFFVRDLTGGSRLPFRIRPGAATSSIDIAASGNVGIGIPNASAPLDIQRGNGTAKVRVAETDATTQLRELVDLVNNGPSVVKYSNTGAGTHPVWLAGTDDADDYLLNTQGAAVAPLRVSSAGGLYSGADPAQQTDVQQVNPEQVLNQIATLPLRTWIYADDADGGRHIGPTAAGFRGASGLGPNGDAISPSDVGGVALAGVQALNAKVAALGGGTGTDSGQAAINKRVAKQLKKLAKQNKKLKKRVAKLEKSGK